MRSTLFPAISMFLALGSAAPGQTNEAVRLSENFAKDTQYSVTCQVDITGELTASGGSKPLKLSGKSAIQYDERVLQLDARRNVERTVRYYRRLEFDRKVGEEQQQSKLRPEAARLVILRHNQFEVPFCPHGPLLWGEMELVRTDVFSPALAGLFPAGPVRVGERWRAGDVAIQELTDVEKIDKAEVYCVFDKITTLLGRRNAHVNFEGKVQGIGEDGVALHELRGSYYVDLDANFLSYVYVKGTHHLLDKNGKATGKIEGTFVMTRTPTPATTEVSDNALRGLALEPNSENTLILFEHPQGGIRFTHPRNWRVAGVNDKQIGIDEKRGSGVLINLAPAKNTPTGAQFLSEVKQWIAKEKVKVLREDRLQALGGTVETFGFDAEIGKDRVQLQYFVMRQGDVGVTLTARILPTDLANTQREVERIARSVQFRTGK